MGDEATGAVVEEFVGACFLSGTNDQYGNGGEAADSAKETKVTGSVAGAADYHDIGPIFQHMFYASKTLSSLNNLERGATHGIDDSGPGPVIANNQGPGLDLCNHNTLLKRDIKELHNLAEVRVDSSCVALIHNIQY